MNDALKFSPPEYFWSCAVAVKNKWENATETTRELLLNNLLCDLCNEYSGYLLGSVGNLGRKSLDSSSELQKALKALNTKRTKYSHFCKKNRYFLCQQFEPWASLIPALLHHLHPVHTSHSILHREHMEDLRFLNTTQNHLLGVPEAEGQYWGVKRGV